MRKIYSISYAKYLLAGIIAIGGFMVILTGGMDISVGYVAALTGIVVAELTIDMDVPMPLSITAGMCVGLCGAFKQELFRPI